MRVDTDRDQAVKTRRQFFERYRDTDTLCCTREWEGQGGGKMTTDSFCAMLEEFTTAGVANDGARFAALFTEAGTYDDDFFGLHRGRAVIVAMLQRFHDTGENYRWEFHDLVTDGTLGTPRSASASGRRCRATRASRC
jgi:hypothetical protein